MSYFLWCCKDTTLQNTPSYAKGNFAQGVYTAVAHLNQKCLCTLLCVLEPLLQDHP